MPRSRKLHAAASTQIILDCAAKFDFAAADGDKPRRPSFEMTAYTGGAMRVSSYWDPVAIDLSGLRAKQRVPILLDHDPAAIVGQSTKVEITARMIKLSGVVTGDDEIAQKVVSHAKNDFEWQASVGVSVDRVERVEAGVAVKVNGQNLQGPLTIVRAGRLGEVSFVAIGADEKTAVKVAASGAITMDPKFKAWLEANGFDVDQVNDQQKPALEAAWRASEKTAPAPSSAPADPPVQAQDDPIQAAIAEGKRRKSIADLAASYMRDYPAETETITSIASEASADVKMTADQFELKCMRAVRPKASSPIRQNQDDGIESDAVEAALCMAGGLGSVEKQFSEKALAAANKHFRHGLGLCELLLHAARRNGGYTGHNARDVRGLLEAAFVRAAGPSTLSIPNILSNTANKFLREGFMAVDQSWSKVAARKNVRDFKTASTYTLTGGFQYDEVAPGGELKHATVGEQSYTNRAKTYGKMFAIDRRDIINDDLDALTAVPRRLGRGGALKLNSVFWATFMNNGSFFTSGNANYDDGADTVLSHDGMVLAAALMSKQTDPDGNPMGMTPRILLVPSDLEFAALRLMNSVSLNFGWGADDETEKRDGSANVFAGKYMVVATPYLSNANFTDYSTTAWYLLADPADVPVIEVAFLNGQEIPIVESADADFNTLGIQMRGYHDFGVALQEYRGGIKMKGAA